MQEPRKVKLAATIGWILSATIIALLMMDAGMKLAGAKVVIDTQTALGWTGGVDQARTLGAILLLSTILYAIPRTALLGAILLTGYLGGAIATQMRVDAPLLSHTLFGLYVGILLWSGLLLRERRLRSTLLGPTPPV